MRRVVRVLVAAFFYYCGLVGVSRWLMRRRGPRLLILNYHRASLLKNFNHSRSDFLRPFHSSAIYESPKVSQIDRIPNLHPVRTLFE